MIPQATSVMSYKGYKARVAFDAEDEIFVGHLAGINDVVGFHANTVAGLKAAFHEAVNHYREACRKSGKSPEKPYSGQVMFRVAPEVHTSAALAAQLAGKSLNQWGREPFVMPRSGAVPRSVPPRHAAIPANREGEGSVKTLRAFIAAQPTRR